MKENNVDMLRGPLWGKILKFTLMYMLTFTLQMLYGAADTIVVANFAGSLALGGVGAGNSCVGLCLSFFTGLSAGAAILLGQMIGANNHDGIHKTTHTSMAIAIFGGVIMSVMCILFAEPVLLWQNVNAVLMPDALLYLRIVAIGFAPSLLYNFGSAILFAKGDSKRPFYIVTISGILNVGLNLFFVCVLHLDAAGVAIATVISQSFTAVAIMCFLCRAEDETRIEIKRIRIHKQQLWFILKYGVPSGVQSAISTFSNLLVSASINSIGAAATVGNSVAGSIISFISCINCGLFQASVTFVSQNYGAKQFKRIKSIVGICIFYAICFESIVWLLNFKLGDFFISCYTQGDAQIVEFARINLTITACAHILCSFMDILSGALRGMGASVSTMVVGVIGVSGLRILWVLTGFKAIGTYASLFYSTPISWGCTALVFLIMLFFVLKKEQKLEKTTISS